MTDYCDICLAETSSKYCSLECKDKAKFEQDLVKILTPTCMRVETNSD